MTYYAVTNDPNELMHFGIKGMKWGITRTPEQLGHYKTSKPRRQRSSAYNRAAAKLSRGMQNGIAKAQANWKEYNSPKNKAIRQHNKQERQFEKHVQLARQGRLKYKGISDAEVQRITRRLDLERQARALSGSEKQSFVRRLNDSVGNGVISGVGQGVASITSERMSRKSRLKTQRMMTEQQNRINFEAQKKRDEYADRRADKNVKREAQREIDKEYYRYAAEQGDSVGGLALLSGTKVNVDEYGRPIGITLHSSATRNGRAQAVARYRAAEERDKHKTELKNLEDTLELKSKYQSEKKKKKKDDEKDSNTKTTPIKTYRISGNLKNIPSLPPKKEIRKAIQDEKDSAWNQHMERYHQSLSDLRQKDPEESNRQQQLSLQRLSERQQIQEVAQRATAEYRKNRERQRRVRNNRRTSSWGGRV